MKLVNKKNLAEAIEKRKEEMAKEANAAPEAREKGKEGERK